ncbi:MAG: hypothetical protein GX945_00200 [Lentisphaerae bacterium]|nr:hypothetical protein [Lentisphaerota bacterium]
MLNELFWAPLREVNKLFWRYLNEQPMPSADWHKRFPADSPQLEKLPAGTRSLLAELALCWTICDEETAPAGLPGWLLATKPLAHLDLSLRDWLKHLQDDGLAMAVFPLAGQGDNAPRLARLYGIKGKPAGMADAVPFAMDGRFTDAHSWAVQLSPPCSGTPDIDGKSWQLAAELIKIAIELKDLRRPLCRDWVISGSCSARRKITKVELGNKLALLERSRRQWLLPEDNLCALRDSNEPASDSVYGARFLADAVTYIREKGVQEKNFDFPQTVEVLHQLVGGAIAPQLSVPLLLNPRKLVLWHSQQTREQAALIEAFFHRHTELSIKLELREIPSNQLALCELTLRQEFAGSSASKTLVNITGGNRMMGQAAMLAAKALGIEMVYRDVNAPPNQLEMIVFDHQPIDLIQNGKITGSNCPCSDLVNWDELFAYSPPRPGASVEELEKKYWRHKP